MPKYDTTVWPDDPEAAVGDDGKFHCPYCGSTHLYALATMVVEHPVLDRHNQVEVDARALCESTALSEWGCHACGAQWEYDLDLTVLDASHAVLPQPASEAEHPDQCAHCGSKLSDAEIRVSVPLESTERTGPGDVVYNLRREWPSSEMTDFQVERLWCDECGQWTDRTAPGEME